MWTINSTRVFNDWYAGLDDEAKEEVIAKVEMLRDRGPALPRPDADTLNGSRHANMKELRGRTSGSEIRIAFAFDPERAAILLCAGDKSGKGQRQFYKALIARADRLYDEHLERIAARRREKERKER
jgi:hypothetical protein